MPTGRWHIQLTGLIGKDMEWSGYGLNFVAIPAFVQRKTTNNLSHGSQCSILFQSVHLSNIRKKCHGCWSRYQYLPVSTPQPSGDFTPVITHFSSSSSYLSTSFYKFANFFLSCSTLLQNLWYPFTGLHGIIRMIKIWWNPHLMFLNRTSCLI
jgi:hypothetical protein